MNVLVIYKEGWDSYKEIIQDYAQSLYVNTTVKAVSNTQFSSEDLKKYDLIYPDVSLVGASNNFKVSLGFFLMNNHISKIISPSYCLYIPFC
jgi:hypothetical protein